LATITFGHHGLLASKREAAILGTLITIILALLFTGLQAFEYAQSSFTIADSVFGSAFFCATGLHGYILPLSIKIYYPRNKKIYFFNYSTNLSINKNTLTLINKSNEKFYLNKNFLEWLSGFTDSEGNFSITLRYKNKNINYLNSEELFSNVSLTFQIGLHINDLKTLEIVKKHLQCGNISISKENNRCNYYVTDIFSLHNIILPIFNFIKLNSSKYNQFLVFEEAAKLMINKHHLTLEGKKKIIDCKKRLNKNYKLPDFLNITDSWLIGFIEGDATFSSPGSFPRLQLENHIKELKLLQEIEKYLGFGSLIIQTRKDRGLNENPTAVLTVNKIKCLKNFIDKYQNLEEVKFYTKKYLDFKDWSVIVNLCYLGYHLLPEGKSLINKLKSQMNNYRLFNNPESAKIYQKLEEEINKVFSIKSPYEIKNGVRIYRGTNNWVSESNRILAIDNLENILHFDSISKCSLSLRISRSKIKDCIINNKSYKNFTFKLDNY
jgi:hypothetical protein